MQDDSRSLAGRIHRQSLILTVAFGLGVMGFAAVAAVLVIGRQGPLLEMNIGSGLSLAVAAVGAAMALSAGSMGRLVDPPPGGARATGGADAAGDAAIAQRHLSGVIVAGAVREGAGLLGGVLVLGSGELSPGLFLASLSALLIFMNLPDRKRLESRLRGA